MTVLTRFYIRDGIEKREICVIPSPEWLRYDTTGEASIDLRLGRWFRTLRQSRTELLDVSAENDPSSRESKLTKEYFVRFGDKFVLHPTKFVLGITLEWIGLPTTLSGYVTGKSSLGRRGLIIETAAGIHPGFKGCLTLELTNVGEAPIALRPGMEVCQIFLHDVRQGSGQVRSKFTGLRKPILGHIESDPVLDRLSG